MVYISGNTSQSTQGQPNKAIICYHSVLISYTYSTNSITIKYM
ncbi:hypothetical protein EHRUM4_07760 [Ehrlichia ruminantium]|nr:hypothetical protein EHRUM4_07760 [Ehrlichia ruminantium]